MMKTSYFRTLLIALIGTLVPVLSLWGKQSPPFGDSLTWDIKDETPSLEAMSGKSVLVLFFQDWCGICNKWSGGLFEQVGKAYGDDPKVVIIAIKTDGGSLSDANNYLEDRTDTGKWLIAVDKNATYYRQALGTDSLYSYMWVDPKGNIQKSGFSGSCKANSDPQEFSLATEAYQKQYRKGSSPLLPAGSDFPEDLKPAVHAAESGLFLTSLKEAAGSSSKEHVATIRKTISEKLDSIVKHHSEGLEDAENESRYLSYLSLEDIAEKFGSSPPGTAAKEEIAKYRSADWIEDEEEALSDYESIMRRAERADDQRSRDRITKALMKLAGEFPDTTYGRIAASSAKK